MRRVRSTASRHARQAALTAAKHAGTTKANAAAGIAVAYALLEVAYQLGRIADNVPIWGPDEEHE